MTNADDFNPNNVGVKGTLFGLPYSTEDAKIVVIPVPWDVTVSYGAGTSDGPEAILEASSQLDYEQPDVKEAWKIGVAMAEIPEVWYSLGKELRAKSEQYIEWLEEGSDPEQEEYMLKILAEVNRECAQLMEYVEQECTYWQEQGKLTVLLGGDHSTPLGHIRTCAKRHANLAILQIDAHADLRIAYEGFEYSHASIMYNALKTPEIKKLVQVGIRDYCEQEAEMVRNSKGRIVSFYDQLIKEQQYRGESWDAICEKIIAELPDKLYLSFDIDGLDPKLCPNTGTPVPGGFEFEQVMYLIKKAVQSGKKIVGADLNEVSPGEDEWDANVGARALYRVINLMAMSQGLVKYH
ncbi:MULTISPECIES: agmatinase family protein [Roseivirga]|uniref:agmatinase family protein n=1 Tax=Roseivirga TaxID=290180 RepID=UPI00257B3208|nr:MULTISPECIES: agmatinase family protein [Roseivirga]|tara:strand:- start:4059 stop:5111 length:1053 start_codon:yes stop_codon:yes gene_type:complete